MKHYISRETRDDDASLPATSAVIREAQDIMQALQAYAEMDAFRDRGTFERAVRLVRDLVQEVAKWQKIADEQRTPPPLTAQGWQLIATAPKQTDDGMIVTLIFGFAPDEENYVLPSREGYWNATLKRWVSTLDPQWPYSAQPTHWKPLPAPPRDQAG